MILKIKFLLVGGFNVVFTLGCLIAINSFTKSFWGFQMAFMAASVLGILVGYQTTRMFVWRVAESKLDTFIKYASLNLAIAATNWFLLIAVVRLLNTQILVTQIVLSLMLAAVSFLVMNYKIFGVRDELKYLESEEG